MARPVLKKIHWWMIGIVAVGAFLIAAIGLGGSYIAVRDVGFREGMGDFARVFPIGLDAGIIVLLMLDLVLTWLRIPFPLLRPTAWLLTAATIAFNASSSWPDPLGVAMHAVIPVLFIIISEAGRHAVARLARLSSDRAIEKIRLMRWVLAPGQTWALWRRMQLWEIRSVDEAIRGEQARLTYKTLIEDLKPRKRRRLKGLPAAAYLPLQLADLGVPMAVTYEAGLAAVGVDAEPLNRLLAHNDQVARSIANTPAEATTALPSAQRQHVEIAQRTIPAQSPSDRIAHAEPAQNSPAQPPQQGIAQPVPAQSDSTFHQVNSHDQGIAQSGAAPGDLLGGIAREAAAAGPLRMDSAWATEQPESPQSADDDEDDEYFDAEEPYPGAPATSAAAGQQNTSLKIPKGWEPGFEAFVETYGRHPEQWTELPEWLHLKGFKSNKAGTGPVSPESVRRYYPHLVDRYPVPAQSSQPSLAGLEGSLV